MTIAPTSRFSHSISQRSALCHTNFSTTPALLNPPTRADCCNPQTAAMAAACAPETYLCSHCGSAPSCFHCVLHSFFSTTAVDHIIPTQKPVAFWPFNANGNLLRSVPCALDSRFVFSDPLSPSLCLFTKMLIHAGRGKIPSAQTHLPACVFPGTPYISSTAIGPSHETLKCSCKWQKSKWEFWSHGRVQEGGKQSLFVFKSHYTLFGFFGFWQIMDKILVVILQYCRCCRGNCHCKKQNTNYCWTFQRPR